MKWTIEFESKKLTTAGPQISPEEEIHGDVGYTNHPHEIQARAVQDSVTKEVSENYDEFLKDCTK